MLGQTSLPEKGMYVRWAFVVYQEKEVVIFSSDWFHQRASHAPLENNEHSRFLDGNDVCECLPVYYLHYDSFLTRLEHRYDKLSPKF